MQQVQPLSVAYLTLISALLVVAAAAAAENEFVRVPRADSPGNDYLRLEHSSLEDCERRCAGESACNAFTYNELQGACFLKLSASPTIKFYAFATTGVRLSPSLMPEGTAPGTGAPMVMLSQADSPGGDYSRMDQSSLEDCQRSCEKNEECNAFTYNHAHATCFLKRTAGKWTTFSAWATTGIKLSRPTAAATTSAPAQQQTETPAEQTTPQPTTPN
ncbi:MAG TPA: PAN domain-containing protein [Terriglobales bacterium]